MKEHGNEYKDCTHISYAGETIDDQRIRCKNDGRDVVGSNRLLLDVGLWFYTLSPSPFYTSRSS